MLRCRYVPSLSLGRTYRMLIPNGMQQVFLIMAKLLPKGGGEACFAKFENGFAVMRRAVRCSRTGIP